MVPKSNRIQPKASSPPGEQQGKARGRGDVETAHSTPGHPVLTAGAHPWQAQPPSPAQPGHPNPPRDPLQPPPCSHWPRRLQKTPTRSSHGQTPPGTGTAWGLGNELAQQPGSCHGGKSPALSHQDLSLHPCCSSVLSSQTRKTPSLHPSALHALPVTLTCRSCCWNWRNWNSLCWEGRAAPFRGPEVQAALPCSHPCSRAAPGHLCQATQRDKVPPKHLHGRGAALGDQPRSDQRRTQRPPIALGTRVGTPRTAGWPGRGCGAFREASESS